MEEFTCFSDLPRAGAHLTLSTIDSASRILIYSCIYHECDIATFNEYAFKKARTGQGAIKFAPKCLLVPYSHKGHHLMYEC